MAIIAIRDVFSSRTKKLLARQSVQSFLAFPPKSSTTLEQSKAARRNNSRAYSAWLSQYKKTVDSRLVQRSGNLAILLSRKKHRGSKRSNKDENIEDTSGAIPLRSEET